jgi:RES domain-containing protein
LRLQGLAYRAHDPRWSFKPLSGDGAAVHGGRFNTKGMPALYLSLDPMTAIKEAAQGFAHKFEPCVLCTYEIDCEDVIALLGETERRAASVGEDELACPWFAEAAAGREPASWRLARNLVAGGAAGLLAPSFVRGATPADVNLILWRWSGALPDRVAVFGPSGRLPKNQLSWDRHCGSGGALPFAPHRETRAVLDLS